MLTSWSEAKAKHCVSFANRRSNRKTESDAWALSASVFKLQDE